MRPVFRSRPQGFSLLEVMVALAIMLVASVSAVIGLTAAAGDLRKGQFWTHQMTLLEMSTQRMRLQSKQSLYTLAMASTASLTTTGSCARNTITSAATGAGCGWTLDGTDQTAANPTDWSTGAFFRILPDGTITKVSLPGMSYGAGSGCEQSGIPADVYCRERIIAVGSPVGDGDAGAGTRTATVWVRIKRQGDSDRQFVALREVISL